MKKTISLLLILIFAFSFAGCASGENSSTSKAVEFNQTVDTFCTSYNEIVKTVCTKTKNQFDDSYSLSSSELIINETEGQTNFNKEIGSAVLSLTVIDEKVAGIIVYAEDSDTVAHDVLYAAALMTFTGDDYFDVKSLLDTATEESAEFDHYSKYISGYSISQIKSDSNVYYTATAMTEDEYNAKENFVLPE